ncbi:MAG: DUF4143 domain-containing protein [Planctomycetes bacterium]|nr:DUF4143 domain-containing protein [Planctomycetota bacterium]
MRDLLHQEVLLRYAKQPGLFRAEALAKIKAGYRTIFVDDVQKLPALLDEVHGLMEATKARFLLTGSSARNCGGRHPAPPPPPPPPPPPAPRPPPPPPLPPAPRPPPFVSPRGRRPRALRSPHAATYLREEIVAEALVRNLGGFARFLDVAAAQSGELLNANAVARDAAVAARTVQEYYQILEDTLLAFRLEAWRKSPRARMALHPKIYFFDLGVLNAINRRLTGEYDRETEGRLFEHLIVLETIRHLDYAQREARPFFWRTHTGAEVDLVLERHGKLRAAIEIKNKERVGGADLAGLRSFREAHPDVPCFVTCRAAEPFVSDGIEFLPWREFFSRLPDLV